MKVLVVEDDRRFAGLLERVLREDGYVVDQCASGRDAARQGRADTYELIVLDWVLPDLDGLEVCRELRRSGCGAPILFVTARGDVNERVLGLEAGADDYLVKPFDLAEFRARVRALVRRAAGRAPLRVGGLEIDRAGRQARLRGALLDLTGREFALLVQLAQSAGVAVARTELLDRVWGTRFDTGSNLVEVHISRLRDKLGEDSWMIETARGVGYRMRSEQPS